MKVLFVDDDKLLLNGIRRVFMAHKEIRTVFAVGGQSGLELLEKEPVDIVVADIRMPGMDGVSFLAEVKKRYPQIIRLVLSGCSDPKQAFRTIGIAHQFLSKPCDLSVLKKTLGRLYELQQIIDKPEVVKMLSQAGSLPVMPDVAERLIAALENTPCEYKNVATILASDVGLAAGVLKAVNSSFFGIPKEMASLLQSVTYLGADSLLSLVRLESFFRRYDVSKHPDFSLGRLWRHSLNVAVFSKKMALSGLLKVDPEKCFNCALLHDLGKLLLLDIFPESYAEVYRCSNAENIPIIEAEKRLLPATHAEVGAYFLGVWGFPSDIVRAVLAHHDPERCSDEERTVLAIVHAANVFEHQLVVRNPGYAVSEMRLQFLEAAGAGRAVLKQWRKMLQEQLSEEHLV